MATVKKRMRARKSAGFTDEHRIFLETGHDFFGDLKDIDPDFETNRKRQEAAWKEHRKEIMDKCAAEKRAGYRPWAWWQFDCKKEFLEFGERSVNLGNGDVFKYILTETKIQLLYRIGELQPWEIKELTKQGAKLMPNLLVPEA
ncbi:hypothetical protein Psfp_02748 [Pelotomaculum sp. FP]|uniref:hypothetical protein n=1 Tax=Pelotomaculum sp. FP TaxID=261474 RepID=UPI0010665035|nr:hypothetical protein [Pelotomaculum sp. FP]TEB14607.1 hypothetical protein Psfp_02748 [Pelotomaculum sp. FP]